jgi:hypothetical protein
MWQLGQMAETMSTSVDSSVAQPVLPAALGSGLACGWPAGAAIAAAAEPRVRAVAAVAARVALSTRERGVANKELLPSTWQRDRTRWSRMRPRSLG